MAAKLLCASLTVIIALINANNLGRFNNRIERLDKVTNQDDSRPILRDGNLEEQKLLFSELPEQDYMEAKLHDIETQRDRRGLGFKIIPPDKRTEEYMDAHFEEQYHRGTGVKFTEEDIHNFYMGHWPAEFESDFLSENENEKADSTVAENSAE